MSNIDFKKEFITFLKCNNVYVYWFTSFKNSCFNEAQHLFFLHVPPFEYISVITPTRIRKEIDILWLEHLIKCNGEWKISLENRIKLMKTL